jgi:hypothetical protein
MHSLLQIMQVRAIVDLPPILRVRLKPRGATYMPVSSGMRRSPHIGPCEHKGLPFCPHSPTLAGVLVAFKTVKEVVVLLMTEAVVFISG